MTLTTMTPSYFIPALESRRYRPSVIRWNRRLAVYTQGYVFDSGKPVIGQWLIYMGNRRSG
jgi:hypothetical protein